MTTTLVLGGTRSGKSRYAQSLLDQDAAVTFVAPTAASHDDDPEWADRIAEHRRERPLRWSTVESSDVTRAILYARGPVLVDCLGSWVTAMIDQSNLWGQRTRALEMVSERAAELAAIWTHAPYDAVAVTNEVGMSLVPQTPSGRLFQEALGRVNAVVSAASSRVHLVIAGRLVDLSQAPLAGLA